MLELVDRHDSGSCVRKGVEVQVLFGAGRLWIRAHSFDNSDSILCVDKKSMVDCFAEGSQSLFVEKFFL